MPVGGVMGLVKPNGTPTMLANSLGIIFYGFDTGTAGIYSVAQDCAPGHAFDPASYFTPGSPSYSPAALPNDPKLALQSTGTTAYGTGTLWGGGAVDSVKPGAGAFVGGSVVAGNDAMRSAVDLQSAGTNAAFIMFATHTQTGGCTGGLICGRGCDLDNSGDICAIRTAGVSSGDTTSNIYFGCSGSATGSGAGSVHQSTPVSTDACGLNNHVTTVVNCVNQGSGSPNSTTDIKVYTSINGAAPTLQAHSANVAMFDVSANSSSKEDQMQTGAYFHVWAGQQFNTFAGYVYQFGVATKAGGWTAGDIASFCANPYQYLKF